jgi:hypothetical protein
VVNKLTRRDLIGMAFQSAVGAVLLSGISCDRIAGIINPDDTAADLPGARPTVVPPEAPLEARLARVAVEDYCNLCLSDDALRNRQEIEACVEDKSQNGWDSIVVVEGFKIDRVFYDKGVTSVIVKYVYVGALKGSTWRPYEPKPGYDSYMTVKYATKRLDERTIIINRLPPLASKRALSSHLSSLVEGASCGISGEPKGIRCSNERLRNLQSAAAAIR